MLKTESELLARVEGGEPFPHPSINDTLPPQQCVLSDKLSAAMEDGFNRMPGLTITGLAEHLGAPEHRLRGPSTTA